jgi:hypothetical protein
MRPRQELQLGAGCGHLQPHADACGKARRPTDSSALSTTRECANEYTKASTRRRYADALLIRRLPDDLTFLVD